MERYALEKEAMGDDFYADIGTAAVLPGRLKDSDEAKSRLVASVNAQIAKRKKFHRRRIHDEDKDITYINERNRKFNEKIDRSYSKYTQEIKQNLERGTAIWILVISTCRSFLCHFSKPFHFVSLAIKKNNFTALNSGSELQKYFYLRFFVLPNMPVVSYDIVSKTTYVQIFVYAK